MSVHSDDTDVLLLIPPDFFLVPSDAEENSIDFNESQQRLLVSSIISQVNDIEDRLSTIENKSITNERMIPNDNYTHLKHFGSENSLNASSKLNHNFRSLQSTPFKTQTLPSYSRTSRSVKKFKGKNILSSNEYVKQKEKDNILLEEIHNFFKMREAINKGSESMVENMSAATNSVAEENDSLNLSAAVFNLNKVNDLLKQLEETQVEIEQKLKVKNGNGTEDAQAQCNTLPKEIFDFSKIPCSDLSEENKTPRTCLNFDSFSPKKSSFLSNKENLKTDLKYSQNENIKSSSEEESNEKIVHDTKEMKGLLSLCTMWGSNEVGEKEDNRKFNDDLNTIRQKYHEELFRRHHCEELIQKIQLLLLEEQEKVAVAIQVDKKKDEAISKLSEGWNKLVNLWRKLENEKSMLEKQFDVEQKNFEAEVTAAFQTVKRYEMELSKALDLAQGYKMKCENLEKEKTNLNANANRDVNSLKNDLKSMKEKLEVEKSQREKLEKTLAAKDDNLSQGRRKISEMQNQIQEHKKKLREYETELKLMRVEKDKLSERLKDEKNKVLELEEQKRILAQSNEDLRKKEKTYKENIKSMNEHVDKIKVELKEFYQSQVEQIVQEKLKEFQDQLSLAEKTLRKEMEDREKHVAETAVKQVQQIMEKHLVEVNILEDKHREEIELWKIKFARTEEKASELQKKVDQYWKQKSEIAQKLQTVMEAQWQEALKIIATDSPKSFQSPPNRERDGSGPNKKLPRQETFTMPLVDALERGDQSGTGCFLDLEAETCSTSPFPESAFFQEGQITSRDRSQYHRTSSPQKVVEKSQKDESIGDDPLKKYIQMLLERPPGFPATDDGCEKAIDGSEFDIAEDCNILQWQQILLDRTKQSKR